MSNVFNFNRFCKYFVYDIKRLAVSYGPTLALFVLMPVFISVLQGLYGLIFTQEHAWMSMSADGRMATFFIVTAIVIITLPRLTYGMVTDKKEGSAWLMLPASRLEKFLAMLIICFVMVPVLFNFLYIAVDLLVAAVDPTCSRTLLSNLPDLKVVLCGNDVAIFDFPDYISLNVPAFLFVTHAGILIPFFYGALLFRKNKIVLTLLSLFGFLLLVAVLMGLLANAGFFEWLGESLESYVRWDEPENYVLSIKRAVFLVNGFLNTASIIWIGGLGLASWFRIKNLKH